MEIGSKTAEKNSAQTNRQTNRHYKNNGHLAVNLKQQHKTLLRVSWPTPPSAAAVSSSDGGCADACRQVWRLSLPPTRCMTTAQNDSNGSSLISLHNELESTLRVHTVPPPGQH